MTCQPGGSGRGSAGGGIGSSSGPWHSPKSSSRSSTACSKASTWNFLSISRAGLDSVGVHEWGLLSRNNALASPWVVLLVTWPLFSIITSSRPHTALTSAKIRWGGRRVVTRSRAPWACAGVPWVVVWKTGRQRAVQVARPACHRREYAYRAGTSGLSPTSRWSAVVGRKNTQQVSEERTSTPQRHANEREAGTRVFARKSTESRTVALYANGPAAFMLQESLFGTNVAPILALTL
jgi:hypothetical protein